MEGLGSRFATCALRCSCIALRFRGGLGLTLCDLCDALLVHCVALRACMVGGEREGVGAAPPLATARVAG